MAGAQKDRVQKERRAAAPSSSGSSTSTSRTSGGAPSKSARSEVSRAGTSRTDRTSRSNAGGYDGNTDPSGPPMRNPSTAKPIIDPKNFDLSMAGWATVRSNDVSSSMPSRQAASKMGQAIKIGLNTYHVSQFPNIKVYQYDVMIGSGVEKRGLIRKVWNSKQVQAAVGDACIFDGNKLAWTAKKIDREVRLTIDMNVENERKNPKKEDTVRVSIRLTNEVAFQTLMAHLQGKAAFDNSCLETIAFADHLLRESPSRKYTAIKRSFFAKGQKRFDLGGGVEAFKGVFASLRIVHPGRLSVNLDVANGTFWTSQPLHKAAVLVCGARNDGDLVTTLQRGGERGRAGQELKRLRKVHVVAKHRGKDTIDDYCIERFIFADAKTHKVQVTDPSGNEVEMTLYEFFAKKYNIRLQFPGLPLVKATKGKNIVLPMEVLQIKENQRYNFKMDERQTSNMIKFAVTAPPERYTHIEHGLEMLDWANDPILKKYGMKIENKKTVVDARLLSAPTVKFGVGDAKPGTSGRWDLKGKKFLQPNTAPLKSWAVCVVPGRRGGKPDKTAVENFIKAFINSYQAHGGRVENKNPAMSLASSDDVGAWVTAAWNAAGNQSNSRPQILVFILPDKDSQTYGRIKRSCECRYGVVSQCVQYAHAQKCQPQYISNVLMKVNAKLGGATCKAVGQKTANGHFTVPTMVIGADVSHAAPGAQTPSMAAMTVSIDKLGTRYAALCQTNGYRVEMIATETINKDLKPMVQHWVQNVGGGKVPQVIVYLRDGVSEGQYAHVLNQEVTDMKNMLIAADQSAKNTKFIVLVGGKRHHVRFFPEKGDRNGNAHPGTLVETGVTTPFENDFYLQSHAAIKGTARPVHYHVLLNEPNMSNDQLITMLYEQSYQYARASTPISQHPAIYYAHLASNRAVPHDPKWSGSSDGVPSGTTQQVSGSQGQSAGKTGSSSGVPQDFEKLMAMPNQGSINTSMWYI
ncbi:hypothetical protein CLAFUR0_12763 [Fulvia fulva]|nr:hypothetical protein CLAFUR0_12763 [Fulvia fulva]